MTDDPPSERPAPPRVPDDLAAVAPAPGRTHGQRFVRMPPVPMPRDMLAELDRWVEELRASYPETAPSRAQLVRSILADALRQHRDVPDGPVETAAAPRASGAFTLRRPRTPGGGGAR